MNIKHSENKKLKIAQLEKLHFIKVDKLKLTQGEIFTFLYFKSVPDNVSGLFRTAHLSNKEHFLYQSNLSF